FGELVSWRILSVNFIAQPPGHDRWMIAVAGNHLAKLLQSVLQNVFVGPIGHSGKGITSPGWYFGLHKNSMVVAVVEDVFVLGPVSARENTVEGLHVIVVVVDPFDCLRHPEWRIAARHALDAHEAHAFAVQVKGTIANLKFANAKDRRETVRALVICDRTFEPIQIRAVKMPEPGVWQGCFKGKVPVGLCLDGKTFTGGMRPDC